MSAADGFCSHVFHPSNAPCSKCGRYFTELVEPVAAEPAASWPDAEGYIAIGSGSPEPAAPAPDPRMLDPGLGCGGRGGTFVFSHSGTGTVVPQPQDQPQDHKKPKAITRYTQRIVGDYDEPCIVPVPNGDYVLYSDHIAALTHRDADVGREAIRDHLAAIIRDLRAAFPDHVADYILARFHLTPKG